MAIREGGPRMWTSSCLGMTRPSLSERIVVSIIRVNARWFSMNMPKFPSQNVSLLALYQASYATAPVSLMAITSPSRYQRGIAIDEITLTDDEPLDVNMAACPSSSRRAQRATNATSPASLMATAVDSRSWRERVAAMSCRAGGWRGS